MHPHVTFDPYPPYTKPHPYHQQPYPHQQNNPTYPTRNNYHYNYSPSHTNFQKQMNGSVQEPFYRAQDNPRTHSNKESRESNLGSVRDQASFNNQTRPFTNINTESTNYLASLSPSLFPNTSKILNLQKFIEQNLNLRKKLLHELQTIKQKNTNLKLKTIISQQHDKTKTSTRDTTPKRLSKDKSSTLIDKRQRPQTLNPTTSQSLTQEQQLAQLIKKKRQRQSQLQKQKQTLQQLQQANTHRRQHLHKLQSETMNQSIHETPLLREKQLAIECLSVEIQCMNQKTTEIKRLLNTKSQQSSVFEMYEKMCREVQRLRKQNNKKSQRLKKLFEKTNQLTNKEENVNMFLMNLKV